METRLYIDSEVLEEINIWQLSRDYEALLTRLTHRDVPDVPEALCRACSAETELLFCMVADEQLIATVQASLMQPVTGALILVSNLVVHDDYERQGHGRRLMQCLEETVNKRWSAPFANRMLHGILTNRSSRGNGEFYARHGWIPLTPEGGTTRLWQKDLHAALY